MISSLNPQRRRLVRHTCMGQGSAAAPSDDGGELPRLALSKVEAASALGVSVDFFDEHVMPELSIVRRGRRRLIPVAELQRWLSDSAFRTVEP